MKQFDYSKVKSYKLYGFVAVLANLYCKLAYRIKYVGTENLPKDKGYILASNHIWYFDPGFIGSSRVGVIHCMAKEEIFENKLLGWFVTHLNAFPIKRGASDKSSLEYAINIVKEGHILGIFPEGTRSKDGVPQNAKAGVALIAKAAQADVVPVAICADRLKIKPFKTKITIRFGETIPYEELGVSEGKTSELRNAAKLIMSRITDLWKLGV